MPLSTVTPYVTILGPLWIVTAILDIALKENVKSAIANRCFHLAYVGTRPFTLAFYGLMVLTSVAFTLLIISLNGGLQTIQEHHGSMLATIKSAGPLLLAVFLKIIVWDYLMAVKSFIVLGIFGFPHRVLKGQNRGT